MAVLKERKQGLVSQFQQGPGDTGSPSVQIALLTERINTLAPHFKEHGKDHASRLGLLKMVGLRRKLLSYVKMHDFGRYQHLLQELNLRR